MGQPLQLKLFWKALAPPTAHYTLFAHLLGADGNRYAQADLPYPIDRWDADEYLTTEIMVPLPAELAAGKYQLVIGLYDPATGHRLPLDAPMQQRSVLDGPDGLVLMQVSLDERLAEAPHDVYSALR
jgi:hypothetical protein